MLSTVTTECLTQLCMTVSFQWGYGQEKCFLRVKLSLFVNRKCTCITS